MVRYRCDHVEAPLDASLHAEVAPLVPWIGVLRNLRVMGCDPRRYGGLSFGNLSVAHCDGFLVTGTGTAGLDTLGSSATAAEHFVLVEAWDFEAFRLESRGPVRPSSESLTHAAVHGARRSAGVTGGAVFHVHAPALWRRAASLELATTVPEAAAGTPAMAAAVVALVEESPERGLLAMGGHEDGVLAWGPTADEAGSGLLARLAAARG